MSYALNLEKRNDSYEPTLEAGRICTSFVSGVLRHVLSVVTVWFAYGPTSILNFLAHRNRSDFCTLRLRCPSWTPEITAIFETKEAMPHCDLRVRWKVASDLRFRAAISELETLFFIGIFGDLALSTRKSLAIAIVRCWRAKLNLVGGGNISGKVCVSRERVSGLPEEGADLPGSSGISRNFRAREPVDCC